MRTEPCNHTAMCASCTQKYLNGSTRGCVLCFRAIKDLALTAA
jgi:hypothetical protein